MIPCPHCAHRDLVGLLFCSECGSPLASLPDPAPTPHAAAERLTTLTGTPSAAAVQVRPEAGSLAALRMLPSGEIVSLIGGSTFSIGRAIDDQPIIPDVDLDAFGAQGAGVSRLHAELSFDEAGICLKDLDSANGTFLNDQRVEAYHALPVKHLDIIRLGNLKFQLLLEWH